MNKKNKISTILMILFLMITITAIVLPTTTAQAPLRKKSYAIIGATPNPVGVGQQVLLHVGITDVTYWPQPGWYDLTVTVTKPDGTSEILGPFQTDTTGGTGTVYVPTMVGTYTLQTHFPEQVFEAVARGRGFPVGTIVEASDSEILELEVTQEPRQYYPGHSLPEEYWTRPINAQLREWYTISGNWLSSARMRRTQAQFVPYNDAPDSGHILWTKPLAEGGLVGGDMEFLHYETGDAYEGKWDNPLIIYGILISNRHPES